MLPTEIQEKISQLCAEGDHLIDEGEFDCALTAYETAASLIPDPKQDWEASSWVFSTIGDAHFYKNEFEDALDAFHVAIASAGGLGNPFIHLRLGQCQFELGNRDKAADELMRAYMGQGREIFEDEDQKYLDFLLTRAQLE